MQRFKYYKRGKGELDTSNFPDIVSSKAVLVDHLDEKTFMSLLALNHYIEKLSGPRVMVYVRGYVAHMRSDKDEFVVSGLYDILTSLDIRCRQIQHESTIKIRSAIVFTSDIRTQLGYLEDYPLFFIGADSSVSKFCPDIDLMATKVRLDGAVTSIDIDFQAIPEGVELVIVDDILGGGATIQMLHEVLPVRPTHLWVQYNEGIHPEGFLQQFETVYLGDTL